MPGLSHQPLQFIHTGNTKFTLELNFEVQDPTTDLDQIHHARRFLQSLCYPRRGAEDVIGGGPPRVDANIVADSPAQYRKFLQERPDTGLEFRILRSGGQKYADPAHSFGLLRVCCKRPRCCNTTQNT